MQLSPIVELSVRHGYILQIIAAEAIFLWIYEIRIPGRAKDLIRCIVTIIASAAFMVIAPNIIALYISGLFSLTIFLFSLVMWNICMPGKFREILFCCVAAQLTQNLSYNIENVIYLPARSNISTGGWLALSLICTAVVYSTVAYVCIRMRQRISRISINRSYVIVFAILTALFVYVMQYLFQVYRIDTVWVARLPLILCCVAGLSIQFGFLALHNGDVERDMLERAMRQEAQQYRIATENIDAINRKAHDLKHQVLQLQSTGSFDADELHEIEQAVSVYEKIFETGNNELDIVLNQKMYLCRTYGIDNTVIADGTCLNFMRPADILSLFGNLLDNAIDFEKSVNSENRYVGVHVHRKAHMVVIRVENYCTSKPRMKDGFPITTKKDTRNHGFGMRSIHYIVHRYGGSIHFAVENNLFTVGIVFADVL